MDRYGSRLRVPSLPPSQTSSTMTSIIEGSHGYSIDSAPRITPRKRPRVPKTPRVRQPSGQLSSRQAEPPLDGLEDMTAIAEASSPRQLPRVSGVGSPEVGRSSFLTAVPAPGVSPGKVASPAVPLPPVVHAHGSLMPRKDQLRKQQQALLKSTEVVFYKRQMKACVSRKVNVCNSFHVVVVVVIVVVVDVVVDVDVVVVLAISDCDACYLMLFHCHARVAPLRLCLQSPPIASAILPRTRDPSMNNAVLVDDTLFRIPTY
ncbi:unnamed protein product [Polarella glacialis]|uniref:Uncharacterized protein n=1 Tax=Polarella glacialis TaxID=89957 RepID=A0A813D752_POLGL|nr:unnamed protein product [Polarella glacialis]